MGKYFIALLLFWVPLQAQQVDSADDGVQIVRFDLYSAPGHYSGAYYYGVNTNPYPVYLYIYLTQAYLTIDGLTRQTLYIEPQSSRYLGWVARQDNHMPFHWYYKWKATPAQ